MIELIYPIIVGLLIIIFAKSIAKFLPKISFFPKFTGHNIKKFGGHKFIRIIGSLFIIFPLFSFFYARSGLPTTFQMDTTPYLMPFIILVFAIVVIIFWYMISSYRKSKNR